MLTLKTKIYASVILPLLVAAIIINHRHIFPRRIKHNNNYEQVFTEIYNSNDWGKGSGPGSSPLYAQPYLQLLQQYIEDPKITTIVDLGCGDWQLMSAVKFPANKTYAGYDVVPSVIEQNITEYSKENIKFYHVKSLQEFSAQHVSGDLLLVKDVLQHWPKGEIEYFIENILPNFKYALITNDYLVHSRLHNKDFRMGPCRSLALLSHPYNLKNATALMEYYGPEHKQVVLFVNTLAQ